MFVRRRALLIGAALAALPHAGFAAEMKRYASVNFDEARRSGKPVVVHIDATWCPTCKAQKPILAKLLAEPRFAAFAAFEVDYDSEKPAMRALNAPDRSTILVFKGGQEAARGTGDTTEPAIAALLEKAL
jgi:thiol-disulfide isomerase/thioredoxin